MPFSGYNNINACAIRLEVGNSYSYCQCDNFRAARYSFTLAGKVHLYKLFFCWDIANSKFTSTLHRKENAQINQKQTINVVWSKKG